MINIDSLTIKAFLLENLDLLVGAKVQKVQQPNRRELILQLRNNFETRKFYININPSFYHICFMSKQNELKRNIKIPKSAAMFCMLLRKYIDGSKIVEVQQPKHERIIEFYFEVYDALNEKSKVCLAIELMGKHSNVILYNYDTNVIIGCAHNVGAEKSKDRELAGTLPYIYPPKKRKKDFLNISFSKFEEFIQENTADYIENISDVFYSLSRPLVRQIALSCNINKINNNTDLKCFYSAIKAVLELKEVSPNIDKDYSAFSILKRIQSVEQESVNSMLDEYFSYHQSRVLISNLKTKLKTIINNNIKKLSQIKKKQEYQLLQIEKADIYKTKADLLMSNLYVIKPSDTVIVLEDYVSGSKLEIDLDTQLSPTENANRYYKLYKKTKLAYEHAQTLIQETIIQLDYYIEQKFYVEIAHDIRDLEDIQIELGINNNTEKPKKIAKEIILDEYEIKGYRVIVGKNSKQNDYLLSKVASANDIWFHPLNAAGSHVILKVDSGKEFVPDEVLFEAAKLTKEYSSGKAASKVPIVFTLRKYVKKATAKGLAFVTYKNETEILVD